MSLVKSNPSSVFIDERGDKLGINIEDFEFDFSTATEYFEDLRSLFGTNDTGLTRPSVELNKNPIILSSESPSFIPYRD